MRTVNHLINGEGDEDVVGGSREHDPQYGQRGHIGVHPHWTQADPDYAMGRLFCYTYQPDYMEYAKLPRHPDYVISRHSTIIILFPHSWLCTKGFADIWIIQLEDACRYYFYQRVPITSQVGYLLDNLTFQNVQRGKVKCRPYLSVLWWETSTE